MRNLIFVLLLIPFVSVGQIRPIGVASIGTCTIGVSMVAIGASMKNPKQMQGESYAEYFKRYELSNDKAKKLIAGGVAVAVIGGAIGISAYLTKDKRLSADLTPTSARIRYAFARNSLK